MDLPTQLGVLELFGQMELPPEITAKAASSLMEQMPNIPGGLHVASGAEMLAWRRRELQHWRPQQLCSRTARIFLHR
jgi:hypothetical protein